MAALPVSRRGEEVEQYRAIRAPVLDERRVAALFELDHAAVPRDASPAAGRCPAATTTSLPPTIDSSGTSSAASVARWSRLSSSASAASAVGAACMKIDHSQCATAGVCGTAQTARVSS